MSAIIQQMGLSKSRLAVAQMKYNQLRSRAPDLEIAVVEGSEDAIFYSFILRRSGNTTTECFFVANGKDNVLGLRALLLRSKDMDRGGGLVFFIDRDFDDMKGHVIGSDVYMTPTYSFENILICRTAFKRLLLVDFKLGSADSILDLDKVLVIFDSLLSQHATELEDANEAIFCVRQERFLGNALTSGSIDDKPALFADWNPLTFKVEKKSTGLNLERLIGVTAPLPNNLYLKHRPYFSALDPTTRWRGKFLFFLVRRFILALIEDRNGKNPKVFSIGNGKVSIDCSPVGLVRALAPLCEVPKCLTNFSIEIPTHKLR